MVYRLSENPFLIQASQAIAAAPFAYILCDHPKELPTDYVSMAEGHHDMILGMQESPEAAVRVTRRLIGNGWITRAARWHRPPHRRCRAGKPHMRISRRTFLLTTAAGAAPAKKLRVLVIDGINNHDWQAGTKEIRRILDAAGRFTVAVSTSPPKDAPTAAWDAWRPDFQSRDVIVSNFNGGHLADGVRWPRPVEETFEAAVRRGCGFVSFHAANNAFLGWEDYNEMIGLGWRDINYGPGLIVDENEKVVVVPAGQGLGPGHGPPHTFTMSMMDPRHPITAGMPKQWLHPTEQLTHGQHGPANPKHGALEKELRILTYALSKDSHRREPMDWVRTWGAGRVYVTLLGHTSRNSENPNCRCAGFETLFARGVEWAASGRVTIPMPARFPSAQDIVYSS